MTDIATLGIQVSTTTVPVATKQLDAMAVSAGRAEMAAQDLGAVSRGKLATGMSAGGHQSKMLAMQLSQVAQQASATGNWVQALAIQLPDMALGFGTVGIAAGVLAGAALPAVASALFGVEKKSEAAEDAMNAFGGSLDAYLEYARTAAQSTTELTDKFGEFAGQIQGFSEYMAGVALGQTFDDLGVAIAALNDPLTVIQGQFENVKMAKEALARVPQEDATAILMAAEAVGIYEDSLNLAADALGVNADQALELATAIAAVGEADSMAEMAVEAGKALAIMQRIAPAGQMLPAPLREAAAALEKMASKGAEAAQVVSMLPELLAAAARAAGGAASAVDGIGTAANNAYGAVAALVSKMAEMSRENFTHENTTFGSASWTKDAFGNTIPGAKLLDIPSDAGFGGGGGGGGSDPYATDLQALIENLQSERSIEDEWYQENLAILQDRRAVEIMGKQAHDAAMVSLHEEYQRRIAEIDAAAQQQRIGDTANLFGALASIAQAGGQRMAKAAAVAQAIEGTVNAYGAAIKALNTPGISLAGRFAAYASVLAAGLKGVSAIRAAGGIGGGGGGSIAAQGATTSGGQTIEYKVYGLERDAVYSGAFIEKIFSGLMEEGKRRGMNNQSVVFV